MKLTENYIKPYEGLEDIKLYSTLNDVKRYLNNNGISYYSEIWSAEEEPIPNPWIVLFVDNCINLYFAANDKLFKIYCYNDFQGSLPNGINLSKTLDEAKIIDASIKYDDDGEDYESEKGYWLEDDLVTGKLLSITVFIEEMLVDKKFDSLNW